jgi:hypothetical protein
MNLGNLAHQITYFFLDYRKDFLTVKISFTDPCEPCYFVHRHFLFISPLKTLKIFPFFLSSFIGFEILIYFVIPI